MVPGQTVGDGRVPMIHGPAEMLVEDQRHAACPAEAAIGEADAVGLDEPRGSGLVSVLGHGKPRPSMALAAIDVQDMAGDV